MTEELHSEPAASLHFVNVCASSAWIDSARKSFNEVSLRMQKSCLGHQLGQVTPVL